MVSHSQRIAVQNDRRRLAERGMSRYEVRGLDRDKALLRQLATRLAADDAEAERIRSKVLTEVAGTGAKIGGVAAWLLRSPLVGADLDLARPVVEPREIDL